MCALHGRFCADQGLGFVAVDVVNLGASDVNRIFGAKVAVLHALEAADRPSQDRITFFIIVAALAMNHTVYPKGILGIAQIIKVDDVAHFSGFEEVGQLASPHFLGGTVAMLWIYVN